MNSPYFTAYEKIYRADKKYTTRPWVFVMMLILLALLFLPWTQNIRARGTVTTLKLENRPQQINTIIAGRVVNWYVKEGDYVKRGDTIVQLSEVKDGYLDPDLLKRTKEQLDAKSSSVSYYRDKIKATESQIGALNATLRAKVQQLGNKVAQAEAKLRSDSMDMIAADNEWKIATAQFKRQQSLYDSGLVSLTQLEQRNQSYQNALAKRIGTVNKFQASRQEMDILRIEYNALQQEYQEKVSKAEGDRFASFSDLWAGEAEVAKLRNQYASYSVRNGLYYVTAPQDGQIIKAGSSGIGEIVKEGDMLVHIVPDNIDRAVELYVRPVDLPLISTGQTVRFLFDGFPAIVFSGWPNASYGTYSGIVSAIESEVSSNGKFKVLVKEDPSYRKWPGELKIGTGANGIALLKDVPVWYELWRNINSFPPDYYKPSQSTKK